MIYMKIYISIVILFIAILLPIDSKSSCLCKKSTETFLPNAKRSKEGIITLVEVIKQKKFDLGPYADMPFFDPFPINYLEVKVLQNLGSKNATDTINILIPGEVECCLVYPRIGMPGDSAFIHAYEWDETDYGYIKNEFNAYCLSECMISSLIVKNGFAIGPITRKKEQRMPVNKLISRF